MKNSILTVSHEFHVQGGYSVFAAEPGLPVDISLEVATDLLESVVSGLQDLMQVSAASTQATLICFAAESALALVYAALAGVTLETERAPHSAQSENVARESGGAQ